MYTTDTILSNNITPPVLAEDINSLLNLKNPETIAIGEFFINGEYGSDEDQVDILVNYGSVTQATLTAAQTGLELPFTYNLTRTGFIWLYDGVEYIPTQVKQYAHSSIVYEDDFNGNVDWVLEILDIYEIFTTYNVVYDFNDAVGFVNFPSVVIEGTTVNVGDTTISNITDALTIDASYLVDSSDLSLPFPSGANPYYLNLYIGTTVGGTELYSESVSTTTPATISISRVQSFESIEAAINNGENIYVKVEVSSAPI